MGCSCSAGSRRTVQQRQPSNKRFTINGQRTTSTKISPNTQRIIKRFIGH